MAVSSSYNTRRHAPKRLSPMTDTHADRLASKRQKLAKRDLFTPPASPDRIEGALLEGEEDATFIGIADYLRRHAYEGARCSRQIAEGMLAEGKVALNGNTPSTTIDAAIRSHFKRMAAAGREPMVLKATDPQFPRKTLFHLAGTSPLPDPVRLAELPAQSTVQNHAADIRQPTKDKHRRPQTANSTMTASLDGDSDLTDLSDIEPTDGLGLFAGPRRPSMDMRLRSNSTAADKKDDMLRRDRSPSPELAFSLSIDEVKRAVQTPAASEPASPTREQMLDEDLMRPADVNIALPPSPFISPQHSDEEESSDVAAAALAQSPQEPRFTAMRSESVSFSDFSDVQVRSPEEVTLGELDDLLSAYD